jgi:succinylarginine dihydrolase
LLDIKLMEESYLFLDELTQLLGIGSIYSFQKI